MFKYLPILVPALVVSTSVSQAAVVQHLRCEYRKDPLGIDAVRPRLSWQIASDRRGDRQTAYQVLVASSPEALARDQGDSWDSGKISSNQSLQLDYAGRPLSSRQRCFWKVRVWDWDGKPSAWSAPAEWAMGLLAADEWKAQWIAAAADLSPSPASANTNASAAQSLPIFRREFAVRKPVSRAVLYACGLGQAEFRLNGRPVSDDLLQPGWTNYRKSCLYQTYDLAGKIRHGSNALGVLLGNGMYNVRGGRYTKFTGSFGPPKFIAQLEIDYADGTRDLVVTDADWKTSPGPITFSCIYGGEDYDARLELPGWDEPSGHNVPTLNQAAWTTATITKGPGGRLIGSSQAAPPIRAMKTLTAIKKTRLKPGAWLYDLGQNCSLLPRITVAGPAGARVTIETGEKVEGDHFVGACDRLASFNYVLRGHGDETWSPRFTYAGARWLLVQGAEDSGSAGHASTSVVKSVEGVFVCSSSEPAGDFACSNDLFGRTAGIIDWAMRSNMMSILTDCPHRERLGWLEQIHLAGPSLMYRYDLATMYAKMAQDMADAQLANGLVPDIAPEYVVFEGGFRDSPEWGSAFVLVPWQVYEFYGDVSLLRRHYDGMKRYVAYLDSTARDHIVGHGLGDWFALESTPTAQVATAFYYLDLTVLEKTARLLGKSDDALRYARQAGEVRQAYNSRFYEPAKRRYAQATQTANALPVVLGIVDPANRAAAVEDIVRDIRSRGNSLTAGDVGYRYLLRALADNGHSDIVFSMNQGADHPGYGMILAKGNTSLPEPWDGGNQASSNHFMLGHIMEWFYADLAGIRPDPAVPGFQRIVIKPTPVGDVTWVKAHYDCGYGRITSNWKRSGDGLAMEVTIPTNTTATVFVPGGNPKSVTESGRPAGRAEGVTFLRIDTAATVYEVGSGTYRFTSR
jgi:alpha-L-rhamnosidase